MTRGDVRLAIDFHRHPKTKKLRRALSWEGVVRLQMLWCWAANNCRTDGDLAGLSDEDIELAVDWEGESGRFVEALCAVGFIDGEAGSRALHDWAEHQPYLTGATNRSRKSKRAALVKHYGAEAADRMLAACSEHAPGSDEHATSSADVCPPHAPSPSPLPSPSPSPPPNPPSGGEVLVLPGEVGRTVPKKTPKRVPAAWMDDVQRVYEHWRGVTLSGPQRGRQGTHRRPHAQAPPRLRDTDKRALRVAQAMWAGMSVDDCKLAVDGLHLSPFHLGENDRKTKYLGLEHAFKTVGQAQQFAEGARSGNATSAFQRWRQMGGGK